MLCNKWTHREIGEGMTERERDREQKSEGDSKNKIMIYFSEIKIALRTKAVSWQLISMTAGFHLSKTKTK